MVDRSKTPAVMAAGPELIQRHEVLLGAVALVGEPAVTGKFGMQCLHHAVARHLGDDGRCRDRHGTRIAVDERIAAAGQGRGIIAVDQRKRCGNRERGFSNDDQQATVRR